MKIQTSRFGEVEVDESLCFEAVVPIVGYENEDKFVIIEHKANANFKWFQSVKTPDLAFAITMAGFFGIDYSFELPDTEQEVLGIEAAEDIIVFNICIIPHENPRAATINLVAPLVLNIRNHKGGQIILNGTSFTATHPLFEKEAIC